MNYLYEPPKGSEYNVTDQIPVNFSILGDCEENISDSDMTKNVMMFTVGDQLACSDPDYNGNGSYNCTWNSTGRDEGNWSINVSSQDQQNRYYDNTTTFANRFWLENIEPQNQTIPQVSPTQEAWSILYNYTIQMSDPEGDETNCTLWVSTDNQQNWTDRGTDTLPNGNGYCSVIVNDFNESDLNFSLGFDTDNYFYFEIEDIEANNTYNTSVIQGPTLERPNITITEMQGNDSKVNRTPDLSESTLFILRVNDTDNNSAPIPMNVTVWVERNTSVWDWGNVSKTNISGYRNYYFAPNCSYEPGIWKWFANSTDYYYQQVRTPNYTVSINGTLTNYLIYPAGQQFLRGSNVTVQVRVNDTCGNNMTDANVTIDLISNKTGESFNCSNVTHVGDGLYNCTFNTSSPSVMPAKNYTTRVYSIRNYYNPDNASVAYASGSTSFWIKTVPVLSGPYNQTSDPVNPGGWGESWTFYVNLTNEDHDQVDLYLWLRENESGSWSDWIEKKPLGSQATIEDVTSENSQQSYTLQDHNDFNFDDTGEWQFKWNASDGEYVDETLNMNFTVTKDDTEVILIQGDNQTLNRSNTSHSIMFEVKINDTDKNQIVQTGGTAYFYVTTNEDTYAISESQYQWYLDKVASISGDSFNDDFPDSDRCYYPIGPQRWRVNYTFESGGYYNSTSELYNINLTTSVFETQVQLPVTNTTIRKYMDNITIRGNLTDECGGVANASSLTFMVEEQSYVCSGVNDEGNGWYNCTVPYSDATGWTYDYYNISMEGDKNYYNKTAFTSEQDAFILVSNPTMDTMSISSQYFEDIYTSGASSDYGWGEQWIFSIFVQDEDQGPGNYYEEANISVYANTTGGWQLLNWTVRSRPDLSGRTYISLSYTNFSCDDIGFRTFKFNVTDTFGYKNETNDTETVNKNTVHIHHENGFEPASIDREGVNKGTFKMRVRDTDSGIWATEYTANTSFWFTLDNTLVNYDQGHKNQTNSTAYSVYNFDPDCNYSIGTGVHYWMGGVADDNCYADGNLTVQPSERDFEIHGQLKNWIITPNWTSGQPSFNVTDQIPIRFNVTSECLGEGVISGADTAHIKLQAPNSSWEPPYTPDEYQSGFYNYTWNSTGKDEGNWSITLNSSEEFYNPNSTYLQDWFWLENIPPENITSPSVVPASDGWTRWFNFTVQIDDPENDTTNCTLWVSTDNQSTWVNKEVDTLANGNGYCSVVVSDFNKSDVNFTGGFDTDNYFYFQIMDEENEWSTSNVSGPTLEPSNVTLQYLAGNDSQVYITFDSSNSTLLLLNVSDDDNQSVTVPMNVTVWVQLNDTDWDWGFTNQTNSTGHLHYDFAPNCSYEPGIRKWYAQSTDTYYEQELTENFTVKMNGTIINTLVSPQGKEYLRGENVTVQVRVNDSCQKNITDANLTIRMISVKTSDTFYCENVTHVGGGFYNCTFNTSFPSVMPANGYDIIINSSRESYISDLITINYSLSSSFFIETEPVIELNTWNLTASGDWGWGETYTFTVNVSDEDDDNMTVRIWVNRSSYGWQNIYTNSTVQGVNQTVTYVYNGFDDDDIGQRQYLINVTDDGDYPRSGGKIYNDTTPIENFTLYKDDIIVNILMGNETVAQRITGYFTFKISVWDTDKDPDEAVGNSQKVRFWYTKDGETWIVFPSSGYKYTNESGNRTFQSSEIGGIDCSFLIMPQWWKGGAMDNLAFKDLNSSNVSWRVMTTPLNATMWLSDDHYLRGVDNVTTTANITESDGCGQVSGACVFFNVTQENERCPFVGCAPELGNGIYQCNVTPSRHDTWSPGDWYNMTMNVTKNYYNGTALLGGDSELFYLATNPYFTSLQAIRSGGGGSTGGWGESWTFQADLYDLDDDYNNVSLYVNLTGSWEEIDNVSNVQTNPVSFPGHQFNCSDLQNQSQSQKEFNFTTIDVWNYTNTSKSTFTLEKDDTEAFENLGVGETVNRDFDDTEILEVYITDTDRGGAYVEGGVFGAFWTTTNESQPNVYILAYVNQTNDNGYLRYTFNPNCSYGVGDGHYWRAGAYYNDTCYKGANSASDPENTNPQPITIMGQLKTNMTEPNQTYASNILVGDNVTFRFGVPTDCSGIGINESYQTGLTTLKLELQNATGSWENCTQGGSINDEGTGWYNCTWNTFGHKGGNYTVRMTVDKSPDYNSNVTTLTDYIYLNNTPPEYDNFSVTPAEDGWGVVYNYSVDIWDTQEDNVTCNLWVKTNNYGGSWVLKNSTIVYGGQDTCSLTVNDFNCNDIGDITTNFYMFELYEGTNSLNTTNQTGPNITVDSIDITYSFGNLSEVNRSKSDITLLIVNVTDTDRNESITANRNVTFWVTLNSSDPSSWDLGNLTKTNTTGHANYSFNPGCYPFYTVGNHSWKAGVTDSCYENKNVTEYLMLKIYGDLNQTIYTISPSPQIGEEFLRGVDNLTQQVYLESDCAGDYINDGNVTIEFVHELGNYTYACEPVYRLISDGYYECNRTTTDMKARWYDTRMNSSKYLYNPNSTAIENHFFIKTEPVLENETVLKDPTGWGEMRNFSVKVTDEDLDNVTVGLYIKCLDVISGGCPFQYQNWKKDNEIILEAPINQTIYLNTSLESIGCTAIGNWSYRFDATDIPHNYNVSTTPHNFTIERDDVRIEPYLGHENAWVWRNGTDYTLLSLKAIDNDTNQTMGSGDARFWVTINASDPNSWGPGSVSSVNSSGYINYNFLQAPPLDECNYTVGVQNWTGGIFNDSCYFDVNSSIYNVTIRSDLRPYVFYPVGKVGYLQGNTVNISGFLEDDCSDSLGYGVDSATLGFHGGSPQEYKLVHSGGATRYCTGNWQESGGWYNCSWDSTGQQKGDWDITMRVDEDYYVMNETTEDDAFNIGNAPYLLNPWVTPLLEGWGKEHTFHVYFGDADWNLDNISLWKSFDNVTWTLVDYQMVSHAATDLYFYERFICADSSPSPGTLNYYKFNVTDPFNYTDETEVNNFTLTEDNVTVSYVFSNSSVRRFGSEQELMKFRVKDDDYPRWPDNAKGWIWMTENGTFFNRSYSCSSSNGYCENYSDPGCESSVGTQYWFGGTNDTCYEYENFTSPPSRSFVIIGQLNITIVNPVNGTIINRNTTTHFNATLKDECGNFVNDTNVVWYNGSWVNLTSGYNASWDVPYNYPLGPNVTHVNATRTNYDGNINSSNIYIYGWSSIDSIEPASGSEYQAGTVIYVDCYVTDANTNQSIQGYNVTFYKNGSYQDYDLSNATLNGRARWSWVTAGPPPENASWYNITCNITDDKNLYYNTSVSGRSSMIRIKRQLFIDYIDRNPTTIYRNDSVAINKSLPYNSTVSVHVKEALLGSANGTNVSFYNSTYGYIGSNTTDSDGNTQIVYNPPDVIQPDVHNIYINATKAGAEDSVTNVTTLTIKGILYANITYPLNGSEWDKDDTIYNAHTDVWDENWNNVTGGTLQVKWYNESGIEIAGEGETTQIYLGSQQTGYRNITAKATKPSFDTGQDSIIIRIEGLADVVWINPPDDSDVPYPFPFNNTCKVQDGESGAGISDYQVNFHYDNGSGYVYNGSKNTGVDGYVNFTWYPQDKGNMTFKCNITDNDTQLYAARVSEAIALIHIMDMEAPQILGTSIFPTDSIEANLNYTNVTANVTDNYQIDLVWAYIRLPNGTYTNETMSNIGNDTYRVSYTPPIGGLYDVTVYARDKDPEYNTNYSWAGTFSAWGKINYEIHQTQEITASNITQTQNYTTDMYINFTNLGPPRAYFVNISAYDDAGGLIIFNDTDQYEYCGNLTNSSKCVWHFEVTVPEATTPQWIFITGNVSWMDPDKTWNWTTNTTTVKVTSNPILDILESEVINENVLHDSQDFYIGNVTVMSIGNAWVWDIVMSLTSGIGTNLHDKCPQCNVTFIPQTQGFLRPAENITVDMYMDIPKGQGPGDYWAYIKADADLGGEDLALMNMTILLNSTWLIEPESRTFGMFLTPPNTDGEVGIINVTNIGNVDLIFDIGPQGNGTGLMVYSPPALDVGKGDKQNIYVNYSIGASAIEGLFYVKMWVLNTTLPTDPYQDYVDFWLNVTDIPPIIEDVNVTPDIFEIIFENVSISAKITDNFAVDKAWIRVMKSGDVNYTSVSKLIRQSVGNESGFNHTETVNFEGEMQYFNVTFYNDEASTVYIDLTVNEVAILINQSVNAATNVTADAVQNASLVIPGDQIINMTVYDVNGSGITSAYYSWLDYYAKVETPYKDYMVKNDSYYSVNYSSNVSGTHTLQICANDTQSKSGCYLYGDLTATGITTIEINPNVTSVEIDGITMYAGRSFPVKIGMNNTGHARAYSVNLTITTPENWSSSQDSFSFGTILREESDYGQTMINVPNSTSPGVYYVNLTANWTELNGSSGFNETYIQVNVTQNPVLDIIQDNISNVVIEPGTSENVSITLRSIGNYEVTNVTFNCTSGVICNNFTLDYFPDSISSMPVNDTQYVNISIYVQSNFPSDLYYVVVNASGIGTYDVVNISVIVPVNLTWTQTPPSITKEVIQGTTSYLGTLTIHNTGNTYLVLDAGIEGEIIGIVESNVSQLGMDIGDYGYIGLNYTAPVIYQWDDYIGYAKTTNTTAESGTQTEETLINITVHPYFVDIIEPTQSNPVINVSWNDSVQIKVNLTYGANPVDNTSVVIWNLTLSNDTSTMEMNLTNVTYSSNESLWLMNITAPNLPIAKGYDINVTANHTNKSVFYFDGEAKAVIYTDSEPPIIQIIVDERVPVDSTTSIRANVTDAGGVQNATVRVSRGNYTEMFNMSLISQMGDYFLYEYNYTNVTVVGTYTLNVTACDKSGNCDSATDTFEAFEGVFFSGNARDEEDITKPPIQVNFSLWEVGANISYLNITTNASGYYNQTIDARNFDLNVHVWNDSMRMINTPLLVDLVDPVTFGEIWPIIASGSALRGISITNVLNFSIGTLTLDYSTLSGFSLENLGVYRCSNWVRRSGCASDEEITWTRLPGVKNLNDSTIAINSTGISGAYVLAEYLCGDGNCSAVTGESTAVCPQDCPAPAPAPPAPPGAPGVGVGVGIGIPSIPGISAVPVEIKSTLIFVTLKPGEHEIHSIDILNNLGSAITVETSVTGNAWELVQLEKPIFTVPGKRTGVLKVKLYALPTTQPGIYTGDIISKIRGRNITHVTPVTIKVEIPVEPLLDVNVKALTKTVEPGGTLKFEVTLLNMGPTAEIDDIVVTYEVRGLETERLITRNSETLAIENIKTFTKTISIPEDTPQDRYVVELNVTYWDGRKSAYAVDSFDVLVLPAPLLLLRAVFLHWLTYVIIFLLIPGFYFGRRFYAIWMERRRARRRYIFPIDFKKLPRAGPDSILVGKVAETDVKAYMDTKALMMHSLAAGATGAGKSVSAMIVAEEMLKRKVPVIVFDPTAQWTGFMKACRDKRMFNLYPQFGLKTEDATAFKTNIILVTDPDMEIDIQKYRKPGEITVFVMNRLETSQIDHFVRKTVSTVFKAALPEEREIKLLLVYDEVHRLLPKYGGKGGYVALERACREFRKWGIGVVMISQVLMDFRGAIRANIATEIQLRTKYEGDIGRVKTKYGTDYASKVVKLITGTALVQNPAYNEGKPYFISFRPLIHDTGRLSDKEIDKYIEVSKKVEEIDKQIEAMKARKIDTSDLEIELNLAKDKMKQGMFTMAESYVDSLKARMKK